MLSKNSTFPRLPPGSSPFLVNQWPASKPWTTSYAPKANTNSRITCSAVPGDVCWLNMPAATLCRMRGQGFAYELDKQRKSVTLTSVLPHANLNLSCSYNADDRYIPVIQCDRSCQCKASSEGEEGACRAWERHWYNLSSGSSTGSRLWPLAFLGLLAILVASVWYCKRRRRSRQSDTTSDSVLTLDCA